MQFTIHFHSSSTFSPHSSSCCVCVCFTYIHTEVSSCSVCVCVCVRVSVSHTYTQRCGWEWEILECETCVRTVLGKSQFHLTRLLMGMHHALPLSWSHKRRPLATMLWITFLITFSKTCFSKYCLFKRI